MKRVLCWLIGHKYYSDGTWGGYGGTCSRCKHNTFFIHDM
jgi:hypothetical protein